MAGIVIDIPERKEKEEKLFREATLDSLTGIANRGAFDSRFKEMKQKFDEDGTGFSLLLLDVDHFKKVNDTWGHSIGDLALKHVTKIMQATLREGDFVARFGGEEFAMLLFSSAPETAEVVAERIRHNIEVSPLVTGDVTVPLTASIGIFNITGTAAGYGCDAILSRADEALYRAKCSGRNRIVTS